MCPPWDKNVPKRTVPNGTFSLLILLLSPSLASTLPLMPVLFFLHFQNVLIKLFSLYNTGANMIILGIPLVLIIDEGQNNKEYKVKRGIYRDVL